MSTSTSIGLRPPSGRHEANGVTRSPSLAASVWLAAGFGLCADGVAVTVAPNNNEIGLALLGTTIIVPFGIFVAVLVAARPSRVLREFTVALVGLYPAVLYRMTSPLVLGGFDEHQHERTLPDLLRGSGAFAPNPMLPISPHYPGLELFTGVGVRLTGVPVVLAMILVVLLCRLILVLAIYHSALTVSPSHRGVLGSYLLCRVSAVLLFQLPVCRPDDGPKARNGRDLLAAPRAACRGRRRRSSHAPRDTGACRYSSDTPSH